MLIMIFDKLNPRELTVGPIDGRQHRHPVRLCEDTSSAMTAQGKGFEGDEQ